MRSNRAILARVVLACLLLGALARPAASEVVDRIVAEVNDEIITMSELKSATRTIEAQMGMKPSGKGEKEVTRQALDAIIDRKLARAEAKKRGMNLSDKELADALERFKRRSNLMDDEALNKALSQAGITLQELKQQIQDQMLQERMMIAAVGSKIRVSETEVRRVYDEMSREGVGGVQVHLRSIKIPFPPGATEAQKEEVQQKAEKILREVKGGASFPEVAGRFGVPEEDLGFVALADINPSLAEHLANLKPRDVAPVKAPEGFQLFQVADRRTGKARSFEEAAPEIRNMLSQKELDKYFSEWVKTLRAKAHIKIML